MCGEMFLVDIQIRDIFNLLNRWEKPQFISPLLAGGDGGEGEAHVHPHPHPPPSRGREIILVFIVRG